MTLQKRRVGEYTVTEAGPLEAARIMRLAEKYQAQVAAVNAKGPENITEEDLERLQALSFWPAVAACTSPMPSMDDWLEIPLGVIAELRQNVEILNPAWFVESDPEQEKKSARRRHKSMKS